MNTKIIQAARNRWFDAVLLITAAICFMAGSANAITYIKADNTADLNLPGSWTAGSGVPGGVDTALWDNTFNATNNYANLGASMTWAGILVSNNLNSAFTINATGTNALTIGTGGLDMSAANQNFTISSPVIQGGNETWTVNGGQSLTLGGSLYNSGNYTLHLQGTGIINLNGNYSDAGIFSAVTEINSNIVNINPGPSGSFDCSGKFIIGNQPGSVTTVNIQSGTNLFNSSYNFFVMDDNASATSTLNINGGQTMIDVANEPFAVGLKGTGVVNVANSKLIVGPNPRITLGSDIKYGVTGASGTLNVNSGGTVLVTNSTQIFAVGNGSSSGYGTGYLNLNSGGKLISGRDIIKNYPSASGYVTFNGGTLQANLDSATFMQGLTAATISANGGTIDDGGFAVTIAQPLLHDPNVTTDGGLTKQGTGTLTLSGANTYNGPTTVNAGTLAITPAAGAAPGDYVVANNATLKVQASTTGDVMGVGAMTLNSGSSLTFDETNMSVPLMNVTNALTTASTVTLNLTGMTLAVGQYPLISYGTLGGAGFGAIALGSVPPALGLTLSLSNNATAHTVDLVVAAGASTLKWNGNISGAWDIGGTANWQGGAFYTETGGVGPIVQFDDSASGPNYAITLGTTVTPTSMVVSNSILTYSISGSGHIAGNGGLLKQGSGTLTLATANTFTNSVLVQGGTLQLGDGAANNGSVGGNISMNKTALVVANPNTQTMNNAISGSGSLTKSGNGTLTLTASNSLSGPLAVNTGTLELNQGGVGGSIPVLGSVSNVSIASGATLTLDGANALGLSNSTVLPPVTVAGGASLNATGGGTHFTGSLTLGDNSAGATLSGSGGIFENGNFTNLSATIVNLGSLACNAPYMILGPNSSLTVNGNLNLPLGSGSTETVLEEDPNGAFPATLTTKGNVNVTRTYLELDYLTWNVDLGTNTFFCNSKITIGKQSVAPTYLNWISGNGLIAANNYFTLADAPPGGGAQSQGTLNVSAGSLVISNTLYRILIGNAGQATVNVSGGSLSFLGSDSIQLGGDSHYPQDNASGTLTVSSNGMVVVGPQCSGFFLAADNNTKTGITGTINLNGGTLTTWSSIVNGSTDGGGSSYINFNGGTLKAGTNNATFLQGLTLATVQSGGAIIDDGGNVITIGQALTDGGGGGGLTKLGSGTLTLTNTSTYTGTTTVSNGTLEVDGSLSVSPVAVASGGTLSGNGTLGAAVTVNAGGELSGGTNTTSTGTLGTLTINNKLTLSGSLMVGVNTNLAQPNNLVSVSGVLTNAGTGMVIITNLGPGLAVGDSFHLFNKPLLNGNAMSIPSVDGVTWTNKLAVDGTIQVLSVAPPINPLPGVIQFSLSSNMLNLYWPTNGGWILQAQTNSLFAGLSTNWVNVPGSTSVTNMSFNISVTNGAVFYRLKYP